MREETSNERKGINLPCVVLGIVFFILLMMFVLPILTGTLNIGNAAGIIFCAIMLFVTWGNTYFLKIVAKLKESTGGRIAVVAVLSLFILGIAYVGYLTSLIVTADKTPPKEDCTVIVLGCQVRGDDPSLMLLARINTAYDYLLKHPDVPCIVTGGKGDDENISEARCMRDILVEKGISPDRIYMEDRAVNTVENIAFSKQIIEENGLSTNTAIVTDIFHEYRASRIVKDAQLMYGSVPADCVWYLLPTYYVRELIAITAVFVGLA